MHAERPGALPSSDAEADTLAPERPRLPARGLGPGDSVGDFEVVRRIGRGGMGDVYLARDLKLGRKVALKVIDPQHLGEDRSVERFLFEARTTARFNHPHIVTVYGAGELHGTPWVALEFLDGVNLRQRMREGPIGPQEALRIAVAIAEALTEAHAHGVLHRDLKPENIFIPRDGRVRVLDFGLAKHIGGAEAATLTGGVPLPSPFESRADTIKGTPAYMAPEQWTAAPCSGATDVWALGLILFELLAARHPLIASSPLAQARVTCGPGPIPRLEGPGVGPEVSALVGACLDRSPGGRPSAAEIAQTLERLLAGPRDFDEETSPFRGLLPFTREDAALFFGRGAEVEGFVERLRHEPILPIVGPSGAGKSSFVRAGVIPRLAEQGPWLILELRPGADPFRNLAARLASASSSEVVPLPLEGEDLAARLRGERGALGRELRRLAEGAGAKVLLFIDQLEELFALTESAEEQRAFLEALAAAADDPADAVRVVMTVRDDFFGRAALSPFIRDALRHVAVLQAPEQHGLLELLVEPLRLMGYAWDDPTLPARMVEEVRGSPAALPLLQFTARLLWDRRDRVRKLLLARAHAELGGVAGALARHADGVLDALFTSEVDLARQLLLRLVTPRGTRRVVPEGRLLEGLSTGAAEVLERLARARLIAVRKGHPEPLYELAHESLIAAWPRLARWIGENEAELAFLEEEVAQAAAAWVRRGRSADGLWRGQALAEAEKAAGHFPAIPPLVAEFIGASQRAERHRARRQLAAVVLGFVALFGAAAVLFVQRDIARTERARAEAQFAHAAREGARAAFAHGDHLEARAKLRTALEAGDSADARILWWRLARDPLVWSRDLGRDVYALDVSADGERVVAGCLSGATHLIDGRTAALRALRGPRGAVLAVAIAPDGRSAASAGLDGIVRLWDLESGALLRELERSGGVLWTVAFDPSGRYLAAGGQGGALWIWPLAGGASTRIATDHAGALTAVRFDPSGGVLATAAEDATIRLWEVGSWRQLRALEGHQLQVHALDFSPDGEVLASASKDHAVRLWQVADGKERGRIEDLAAAVWALRFSPDGRQLALGDAAGGLVLWDLAAARELRRLPEHGGRVSALGFAAGGRFLATASWDGQARLFDLAAPHREGHVSLRRPATLTKLAVAPDGRRVITASEDGLVRILDAASGVVVASLEGHRAPVSALAISADGQRIASGARDGEVRVWSAVGRLEQRFRASNLQVVDLAFSPDGRRLASAADDLVVTLWDASSGAAVRRFAGHPLGAFRVRFSADGARLLTAGRDGSLRIWRVATGALLTVHETEDTEIWGASWLPDGRVVTGGFARAVRIGLPGKSEILATLPERVVDLASDREGRRLVAHSADGSVVIWDLRSGTRVDAGDRLRRPSGLALSDDGRVLAVTSESTVRLFDAATLEPLWGAPLLDPPRLITRAGSVSIDGEATADTRWAEAVARSAARASRHGDWLCLLTWDGAVELWSTGEDRRVRRVETPGRSVVATPEGCVVAGEGLVRYDASTEVSLALRRPAVALAYDKGLVAIAGTAAHFFGAGAPERVVLGRGLTAAARRGTAVLAGYEDGALIRVEGEDHRPFDGTPSSPAVRVIRGPAATWIAGFENGMVGLWDDGGARLDHFFLAGAVEHLAMEGTTLFAATDVGDHHARSLAELERSYCAVLREVWASVPVRWQDGHPVVAPRDDHPCQQL